MEGNDVVGELSEGRQRIPSLPAPLAEQLRSITPSRMGTLDLYPCRARLTSGESVPHVLVANAPDWVRVWGGWPWEGVGGEYVSISDVASLTEDPDRLPAPIATEIYRRGERMMGGTRFELEFRNGARISYVTGNLVDFLETPEGLHLSDVVDVHELDAAGDGAPLYGTVPQHCCLYWDA